MATIITGSYVSTGAALLLDIPSGVDRFELYNYSNQNSTANPGVVKQANWFNGMPAGSAFVTKNTNSAATDSSSVITSGGFTLFNDNNPVLYPAQALSGISQANPAVVSETGHGYSTGDYVRLTNLVGMTQLNGILFQITVIDANSFSIPINTSGFAAAATGGYSTKVQDPGLFEPADVVITNITQATNAQVSTSVPHNLTVGAYVNFYVYAPFGMVQIYNMVGQVISVVDALNYVVNINTSAFTAFAYPASGGPAYTQPQALPIGEQVVLTNSTYNAGQMGIIIGSAIVGASGDVVYYAAYAAQQAT
jgi:hypothetical protein